MSPDDGHTFRIAVSMRGSSKVVGDEHSRDEEDWYDLEVVEVRAWSLKEALERAHALPFTVWFPQEEDERKESRDE